MKKLFTLCVSLFMGCVAMNAQSFSFVDENGNVIEKGSTLTMDQVEYVDEVIFNPDAPGGFEIVKSPLIKMKGVKIKNNSSSDASCDVTFTMEKYLENSTFQTCCGGTCVVMPGEYDISVINKTINIGAGNTFDISADTELKFGDVSGTCSVKINIKGTNSMLPDSEITVNFVYDGTSGIDGIQNNANNKIVARYSIDGQLLDAPQKGVNILKYADGRTEKVIVK